MERVAVVGAEGLQRFYDVTLIVLDSDHVDYHFTGKIIDIKVSLEDRRIWKRIVNLAKATWKLRNLKKKHDFDLVISHSELANLPNVFSGGKQIILTVHENRFSALKDAQGKFVNRIIKYIYSLPNISQIVTVSEGIKESFINVLDLKKEKLTTIYNPYAIEEIKKLSENEIMFCKSLFSSPVLLTAGRLSMAKGQWYLLRIFKALKKTHKDLKLVILGDGELKDELIQLSNDLGLNTYSVWSGDQCSHAYDTYFLGFQKNPFQFIKQAKLFAMTSLWEGFGGTIVESMACGTPVISANCRSGPGEIIYGGAGVLMPVFKNTFVGADSVLDDREQLWVNTLGTLLDDDEKLRHYSAMGLRRAEDFGSEPIIAEWRNLIDVCLDREK